ncbi:hypothetical protein DKQ99_09610 [Salmonella enterica]|nr:hypothetical protein LFZ7_22895 [Salmonella enterica subsp. enterica serovar Crossness str. 1422-74]EBN1577610.1 hypothetical protein [Salmonella enterica]EBR9069545.1 hypothetical protein [Salmonella enterica subsp. enterica serovar Weltevreden]KNL14238.1 hypothetical protein AEU58_13825 [Salmonella enterica subsp. enterica serovar Heidelberg]
MKAQRIIINTFLIGVILPSRNDADLSAKAQLFPDEAYSGDVNRVLIKRNIISASDMIDNSGIQV